MARHAAGDLEGAEAALRECLQTSKGLPMFGPWAAARLASVLVARGQLTAAEPLVAESMALGVPFTLHAARLALAELAAARGDPDAVRVTSEALELAEAQDHLATAARLRSLLGSLGQPAR